jgi:hypothetical protein
MDDKRKRELRKRYLRATGIVNQACDGAPCGLTLLRYISPDVDTACREIDAIRAEIKSEMTRGNWMDSGVRPE